VYDNNKELSILSVFNSFMKQTINTKV